MIRPALPPDLPAVRDIWNPVIRDTAITFNRIEKTTDDLLQMLQGKAAAGHAFLVVETQGTVAGFATYGQFRTGVGYARAMEHTIILASHAHGKGLGRALMEALARHASAAGARCLIAGISGESPQSRAFHRHIGFADVATIRQVGWKFGRFMDLHLMQKMLP